MLERILVSLRFEYKHCFFNCLNVSMFFIMIRHLMVDYRPDTQYSQTLEEKLSVCFEKVRQLKQ